MGAGFARWRETPDFAQNIQQRGQEIVLIIFIIIIIPTGGHIFTIQYGCEDTFNLLLISLLRWLWIKEIFSHSFRSFFWGLHANNSRNQCLQWRPGWTIWSISSPAHSTCHVTKSPAQSFCLPLTSRQPPVVPTERRALHLPCPVVTAGQYETRTRLAGCWALQSHRAQRNKSRQRGRLHTPPKPREKKAHFLPLPPRWLASFPPPLSLQQTNIAEDKLLCSRDDDSQA